MPPITTVALSRVRHHDSGKLGSVVEVGCGYMRGWLRVEWDVPFAKYGMSWEPTGTLTILD